MRQGPNPKGLQVKEHCRLLPVEFLSITKLWTLHSQQDSNGSWLTGILWKEFLHLGEMLNHSTHYPFPMLTLCAFNFMSVTFMATFLMHLCKQYLNTSRFNKWEITINLNAIQESPEGEILLKFGNYKLMLSWQL